LRSFLAPLRPLAPLLAVALLPLACKARRLALEPVPGCQRCHGGNGSAAPPGSVAGYTETTARPVGAHRQHLADGSIRRAIPCEECHVVPTRIDGHFSDGAATLTWNGTLAGARGAAPSWDPEAARCRNVYCHGGTLDGGTAKDPIWTQVDGTQKTCGSCHGDPPGPHSAFRDAWDCHRCHPGTVLARAAPSDPALIDVAAGKHVDGNLDLPSAETCDLCHDLPPDTGAHRAHADPVSVATVSYGSLAVLEDVSPSGGTRYEFGCGHCHPLDPADHRADMGNDGLPDVVLAPPAPPVAGDELKARNQAAASYDPGPGTCSGVYCHSSGQETPEWADRDGDGLPDPTPPWTAPPGTLGCAGCHGNPPQYASGGEGSATANSHVGFDDAPPEFQWEWGHFAGMPGAYHTSKHGGGDPLTWGPGQRASPITCQACHSDTVDPSKVRSGGFFYFDPGGDYDLSPAGDPSRGISSSWQAGQCVTCHAAELGSGGRARPLRHVNGKREVTFDRRTALPDGYDAGLPPLASSDPVRPYTLTTRAGAVLTLTFADCVGAPEPSCGVAADVVMRDAVGGDPVLTFTLEHATYDPATKTCTAVACHLDRQQQVESLALPPLRWGASYSWFTACSACHQY